MNSEKSGIAEPMREQVEADCTEYMRTIARQADEIERLTEKVAACLLRMRKLKHLYKEARWYMQDGDLDRLERALTALDEGKPSFNILCDPSIPPNQIEFRHSDGRIDRFAALDSSTPKVGDSTSNLGASIDEGKEPIDG